MSLGAEDRGSGTLGHTEFAQAESVTRPARRVPALGGLRRGRQIRGHELVVGWSDALCSGVR